MSYRKMIGKQLKKARKEAKISMRDLAKSAGVSTSTICNIENGKIKYFPQKATLSKLADRLGKPLSFFKAPEKEESFDLNDLFRALDHNQDLNNNQKMLIREFTRWVSKRDVEELAES